jgi:hypothetical protein
MTPLLVILFYLLKKGIWRVTRLQKLSLLLPALVFLSVGLIASAKIGGGSDLHNLDMFLVTLTFMGALAWRNGGREWLQDSRALPAALKIVLALFLIVPALPFLLKLYPLRLDEPPARLIKLADIPDEKSLNLLPSQETVDWSLETLRAEVNLAKAKGDVLFMDQRQLLTFGYVTDVPLVVEYEKKVLMNAALDADEAYFAAFYKELAARRFSLIVSSPLRKSMQGDDAVFGEENDSWVKFVARPILCYYEVKVKLSEVGAQLLVPRPQPEDEPYCLSIRP